MATTLALLFVQGLLGAVDNLWHHELTERLASRSGARRELALHALRAALYVPVFLTLGWLTWQGWTALAFAALLLAEICVTLLDFVQEDRSRILPSTERVLHTILAVNYGALLATLIPQLVAWQAAPAGIVAANRGMWSWLMTLYALGAAGWSVRDAVAAWRLARPALPTWQRRRFQVRRRIHAQTWLVTGATGFIGSATCRSLIERGDRVIVLARNRSKAIDLFGAHAEVVDSLERIPLSRRIDGIVNLAGEAVAARRWSPARKAVLIESRVGTTRALVEWVGRLQRTPRVLVSASAVGWYGTDRHPACTEQDRAGCDFQAALCGAWEREARRAEVLGMRVVVLRMGLVLGASGGLAARLLPIYRLGLGARLGDGRQAMPWVHLDDVLGMIEASLTDERWRGAINAVAPESSDHRAFSAELARAVGRPLLLTVPAWPVRLALGEMSTLLLDGQHVVPERLLVLGYGFRHRTLKQALERTVRDRARAARLSRTFEHA